MFQTTEQAARPTLPDAGSVAPKPSGIRAQLERILASDAFDASERNRRFLAFIVEETLAGRAERIKAYLIATKVFGRGNDFDPQLDPIIRIEAGRLRRSLERYYLTAGRHDPLRIRVPKGAYVPAFERLVADPPGEESTSATPLVIPASEPSPGKRRSVAIRTIALPAAVLAVALAAWAIAAFQSGLAPFDGDALRPAEARRGPAIFVIPFEDESDGGQDSAVATGFARDITVGLTRFQELFVFAPGTSFHYPAGADHRDVARELKVDYLLSGAVALASGRFRATVTLIDAKRGRVLWSERFDTALQASDVLGVREAIADRVVQAIAQPYGVMFTAKARETEGKPPQSFSSYECVLHFHLYWRKLAAERYEAVRECLQRAVARDPDYAEAFAALAFIHIDAYRFKFDDGVLGENPLARALELANRAVELAPRTAAGYKARHLALWMMQDVPRSFEAARTALALNPYDTDIMGDLGTRLCLTGDWDAGLALVREAFARNPAESSAYRVPLALHHYMHGAYRDALVEAQKIDMPRIIYPHMLRAIAHAQLGNRQEASAEVERIRKIDPGYGDRVVADLERRNVHRSIIAAVIEGLRRAGMTGADMTRTAPYPEG